MNTIKLKTKDFLRNVNIGASFANKANLYGDIKISFFSDGKFKILSFNQENAVSIKGEVISCDSDISVLINSITLINALKNITDDEIELIFDNHILNIKYKKGFAKVPFFDIESYPIPVLGEKKGEIKIPTNFLHKSIERGLNFCALNDFSRPILTCLNFEIKKDKISVSATDTVIMYYDFIESDNEYEFNINISNKVLGKIVSLSNNQEFTQIMVYENFILIKYDNISIISRIIEGKYPNCLRVIESIMNKKVQSITLDRKEFIQTLKRLSITQEIDEVGIKSEHNINSYFLNIIGTSSSTELASSYRVEEKFECKADNDTDILICFYIKKLNNALRDFEDLVSFNYSGTLQPICITNDINNSMVVIMPISNTEF